MSSQELENGWKPKEHWWMWVGILDERVGFVRKGAQASPRRCVLCRGTTARERSAAGEEGRWWGPHCGEGRHQDKTNSLTMETLPLSLTFSLSLSLSLSLFSRKTTELNWQQPRSIVRLFACWLHFFYDYHQMLLLLLLWRGGGKGREGRKRWRRTQDPELVVVVVFFSSTTLFEQRALSVIWVRCCCVCVFWLCAASNAAQGGNHGRKSLP